MRKKHLLMMPCMAAIAIAAVVGTKSLQTNASNSLLMANVEALSNGEPGHTYRYPENKGKAQFCTLYVYMKAGVKVAASETEISQYEGSAEYTKSKVEGLKDKCPLSGKGCDPYSCQEVAY